MENRDLYWVTTIKNEENWFVVASSKTRAEEFHENGEGFGDGEAKANLICKIPHDILIKHHKVDDEDWPIHELLIELGFRLIEDDFPRIVSYNGILFYEGKSNLKIVEEIISKYCGLYIINAFGTNRYKIGFTKNLKARLCSFRTALPIRLDLIYFVITNKYVWLEKILHNDFKEKRIRGEWFEFDDDDLYFLETILGDLNSEFHFINVKKELSERG